MKTLNLLLLVLLFLVFNCIKKEEKSEYILFLGIIENPIIDSLQLLNIKNEHVKTIHLAKDNTFIDTLYLQKGYYTLRDKQNFRTLFLSPTFNIKITLKYTKNKSQITFQGRGANENNYLQQKIPFDTNFRKVKNYKHYLSLDENGFLKLYDSIYKAKIDFLNTFKNLDKEFVLYESFALKNDRIFLLNRYKKWKGEFIKDKKFKVSNNYPNPYKNIDFADERLLNHPNSLAYFSGFIKYKTNYNTDEDTTLLELETIERELKNQTIKEEVAYANIKFNINKTKMLDKVYKKYMSIAKNDIYKNEINNVYKNLKKISKGTVSPTFELYDISNNLVTLESLRGKLIYIDIWATWCIPCLQEIPALNELEKEFKDKNIYFVSICFKDTKARFKEMVKEKELKGIQLFAPDESITFFKEYFLTKIPRHILIDKDGKIIDGNAYNPSNPKLKEQLLKYL